MDIVERLRTQGIKHPQQLEHWRDDAADEIERLRAELEALRVKAVIADMPMSEVEARLQAEIESLRAELEQEKQNFKDCHADYQDCAQWLSKVAKERDELVAALEWYRDNAYYPQQAERANHVLAKLGADKTGEVG